MTGSPVSGTPSTWGSRSAGRARHASALLALALLVVCLRSSAQEQVAAVWKERELAFPYRSSTAVYGCRALEGRVAQILRAVGARDDLRVAANDCSEFVAPPGSPMDDSLLTGGNVRQQYVHLHVRLMMPVEVTPEVLDEMKRDKSRRELVSRVTGNPAPRFDDPIVFAAQWQPVTLSDETIGLEPEECELLEQMSATAFRQLGVRVVRRGSSCDPRRVSRFSPEIVVEALVATPFATGQTPQAGEGDADPQAPAASDDAPAEPASGETPE